MLCDIVNETAIARMFNGKASPATALKVASSELIVIMDPASPEKRGEVEGPLDQE